ncbi:glycosyltransferase family 4 protein [Variovorax ginsengisoli]|uniref:Glycosyltransferase involved in cell wall biosynthesis n=1 Tax=Variovorax ginsengisoli TaxID=363844 RepID=A0ABT9SCX4_9BURK|nr:glycosyltransferase family 1 protein [Variovorax ginsengisoli]MDP9902213.1 glycosyltransferase involved in cell wall biosynthesis [Variovorax ginsengisoli]
MLKKFSVGVDFHTFDGIYQGSRSYLLGIYSQAIMLAPQIRFVFFLANPKELIDKYPVFAASNVDLVYMKPMSGIFRLFFQLPFLRLKHGCDILHVQYRASPLSFGLTACTIHDVLVETHREFFPGAFRAIASLSFRLSARVSNLLFTVSEYSKSEICKIYGVAPSRVLVTHNGVGSYKAISKDDVLSVLSKYELIPKKYWLIVGRLEPRKNHLNLIRAWFSANSSYDLVVVGQRDFSFASIFEEVVKLGCESRVKFFDSVSDFELPAFYSGAFAFVYPSFAEGFGMPILEAMAYGVPVISSNTTSMPEVGGDAAFYVDPNSVEDIANTMKSLEGGVLNGASAVEKGYDRLLKFNWGDSARVLVDGYEDLMGRGHDFSK